MAKTSTLDKIISKTVETVGKSREQIFEIGEQSRLEYQLLEKELKQVRDDVSIIITKSDTAEKEARIARNRLAKVSQNFQNYSTEEVKKAYENANDYQVKLAILQQEEKQLRERRDSIERRLYSLEGTIERAENLAGQMAVVFNFLTGDLQEFGEMIEDAKEKQQFGLKIIEAQEEERKRLSREIHDGPAQMMANMLLRSEIIERIYQEKGIEQALEEIKDLRVMVKSSLAEVRRIIYNLRPMALDDLGLIPTLNKYLKTFEEHTNMVIRFVNVGKERRLPQQLEIALFRLVQEAVQNANKHANPNEVHVKIEIKPTKVMIIVKDDGTGFNLEEKKEGSFGLVGMKERVNMLKGEMMIDTAPKKGTLIVIGVPLH